MLDKINAKRDTWELNHLGNFDRVYPPIKGDKELAEKYAKYLNFSQACYISATGGSKMKFYLDIKRNNKVSLQMTNVHTTNDLT